MCCLHLFDQLFPEVNELDSETIARLAQLRADGHNSDLRRRRPVTLETIKAMSGRDSDLRFLLFSPELLFGAPTGAKADEEAEETSETDGDAEDFEEVNSTWRDEEAEETSSGESSSAGDSGAESDEEKEAPSEDSEPCE